MSSQLGNLLSDPSDSPSGDKARRRLVRVWTAVGAILLIVAAVYAAGIISNAIGVIAWTAVFVFILRGPVNWLDSKGVNRTLGTLLAYAMLVVVIGLLVFIMFSPLFGINTQFEDLLLGLPTYFEALETWALDLYAQYADILQSDAVRDWAMDALSSVGGFVQTLASSTASGLVAAGTSLANTIMCMGFGLVIAYWMLVDLPRLGREAHRLISDERRQDAQMIYLTVTRVVGGYLKATIIQCAIIGVACGIMFTILGVPSPAAIAVITGLLNIIPIIGPWLGGGIAFVASLLTSPIIGVISLVGTIIIQQIVYTFVSPKLMGDSVDIHPALTFVALMAGSGVGAALGGLTGSLVGALLSIPLVAIVKSLFVYYFEKRTGRRIVAEDGVFFKGSVTEGGDELDPIADATSAAPPIATGGGGRFPAIADLSGKQPKADSTEDDPEHTR